MASSALNVLVRRIEQLPSLPTVVHELIEVCKDPNATMAMVEEVIRTDQSLTARMLKLVNSAFFALSSRVSSIHHAAVILGMDALRNTAIAVCTYECLAGCDANVQFDRRAFWEHAVAVGIFGKGLARAMKYSKPDEAFVAGLLHDLGKVVLDKYFPDEFGKALVMAQAKATPLHECEKAMLGFDHCQAGAEVARQWRFPPQLISAIEKHHDAEVTETLWALVAVANEMAKAWRSGASGEPHLSRLPLSIWQRLGLEEAAIREVVEESRDEIIAVQALFRGEEITQPSTPISTACPASSAVTGTRLAYVTDDMAVLHPLAVYLETAGFDVLVLPATSKNVPQEAECLIVEMADTETAARTLEGIVARQPAFGTIPTHSVTLPFAPETLVNTLRATLLHRPAGV